MRPIRTMIIDDEALARQRLRTMLADHRDVMVLGESCDGIEAVSDIERLKPDLIFLDIQMPELDGFEVVRNIEPSALPIIVFVTAFDQHAVKAFEFNALDYLLKPFDQSRLGKSVSRVRQRLNLRKLNDVDVEQRIINAIEELNKKTFISRMALKSDGRVHLVLVEKIAWIQAAGNYLRIHVGDRQFLLREPMKRLEQRIDPNKFVRIHRSTIVNMEFIQDLEPTFHGDFKVTLVDGTSLPLSRKYRSALCGRFGKQL